MIAQPVLHTDDTPIRVLAPGTGKTRLARFWVYAVDQRPHAGCDPPAAFYCYSADRRGERPRNDLAGFSGIMHVDVFTGYDALYRPEPGKPARILPAACWAHARRALFKAHGVEVLYSLTFRTKDTDYSAQVTKAKSLGAEGIGLGSCYQNAGAIAKEMQKQGLNVPVVGGACAGAPGFIEIAGGRQIHDGNDGLQAG